jgi:toxin YoeB
MRITFTPSAWEDYLWLQENDRKLIKRINLLIRDCSRSPFEGIGKPEPLKGELSGNWSRRITQEHRLVYHVTPTELIIVACRFHYGS